MGIMGYIVLTKFDPEPFSHHNTDTTIVELYNNSKPATLTKRLGYC